MYSLVTVLMNTISECEDGLDSVLKSAKKRKTAKKGSKCGGEIFSGLTFCISGTLSMYAHMLSTVSSFVTCVTDLQYNL